ncbi:hypothetical protein CSA37_12735 [Candidatus Fermentibacteria bacterium]|nr:MAG: hypothetical protein CSA37_12735 [Candidatus Fermentibacteria bacterium]
MKILVTLLFMVFASLAVADVSIVATIDAPDTLITGLGYGNGSLWAVNSGDEIAYQLDPGTGSVLNSWTLTQPGAKKVSGCTFANSTLYVCAGNLPNLTASYCYKYTTSGTYSGSFSLDC